MLGALFAICLATGDRTVEAGAHVGLGNGLKLWVRCVIDDHALVAWNAIGDLQAYDTMPSSIYADRKSKRTPNPTHELRLAVGMIVPPSTDDYPHVAFRLPSTGVIPSKTGDVILSTNDSIDYRLAGRFPNQWFADFSHAFPGGLEAVDLSVGIAFKNWHSIGRAKFQNGKLVSQSGVAFQPAAKQYRRHVGAAVRPTSQGGSRPAYDIVQVLIDVKFPKGLEKQAFRMVGFDKRHKPMKSSGWIFAPHSERPTTFSFNGEVKDLRGIELQTEPYTWTTFKGVRVRPKA